MDKSKLSALGQRIRIGGERLRSGSFEMGRRVGDKMKEILQGQSQESKMVDEATMDTLEDPNWGLNLRICSFLNNDEFDGQEVMRAIKKKIAAGKNVVTQRLSLDLLETCAMNCDKVFSQLASEKLLEEMILMIDNPQTHEGNRRRAMQLIRAWGESEDLRYLPVFRQTYLSLKERQLKSQVDYGNVGSANNNEFTSVPEGYPIPTMPQPNAETYEDYRGPLSVEEKREILLIAKNSMEVLSSMLNSQSPQEAIKDELTSSMLKKCKDSQPVIQRILETVGEDEKLLFEALSLHEELEQLLSKHAEVEAATTSATCKMDSAVSEDDDGDGDGGKQHEPHVQEDSKDLHVSDGGKQHEPHVQEDSKDLRISDGGKQHESNDQEDSKDIRASDGDQR